MIGDAGRSWAWFYCRCVLWGLATGAGAGAGFGALISGTSYLGPASAFPGAIAGAFYGGIFAIIPSLLAAAVVAQVLYERGSVGAIFSTVAVVINAAALIAIAAFREPEGLLLLLAADMGGVPVLWLARASITRAMADAPA